MKARCSRLFPKRYDHNYYVLSRLRDIIAAVIDKHIRGTERRRLIDYGCGDAPYLPLFADKVAHYVTCDIARNPRAEVTIREDGSVPLPDKSFDLVLSVQVLEHVDDYAAYLAEANRLLEEDGLLLLSTHGQWIWHPCPRDLWRWTSEGLVSVVEKAGFTIVDTYWISGMLAYGSQLRLLYLKQLTDKRGSGPRFLFRVVSLFSNMLMKFQDRLEKPQGGTNAAIYFIVAQKKR